MGFLQNQNQNQNLSSTLPEVTYWESSSQPSSVTDTIIVLGLMAFALQLCLLLFIAHRLWRVDTLRKTLTDLERPAPGDKVSSPPHLDSSPVEEENLLPCVTSTVTSSSSVSTSYDTPYPASPLAFSPLGPFIHWDLVQ